MPEDMRGDLLPKICSTREQNEEARYVFPLPACWETSGGDKRCWVVVATCTQVATNPVLGSVVQEDRSRFLSFADDRYFVVIPIKRTSVERERFGYADTCRQDHFDERSKSKTCKGVYVDGIKHFAKFLVRENQHIRSSPIRQTDLRWVKTLNLEHCTAELQKRFEHYKDARLARYRKSP